MLLPITSIFAALLALFFVYLAYCVISLRFKLETSLGLGADPDGEMLRRVRAHGNFTEYAPMGLTLIALVELNGAPSLHVIFLGGLLVLSRTIHAYAFLGGKMRFGARKASMILTFAMLIGAAVTLLVQGLF